MNVVDPNMILGHVLNRGGNSDSKNAENGDSDSMNANQQMAMQQATGASQSTMGQANGLVDAQKDQLANTTNNIQEMGKQIATNVSNDRPQNEQRSDAAGRTVNSNTQIA